MGIVTPFKAASASSQMTVYTKFLYPPKLTISKPPPANGSNWIQSFSKHPEHTVRWLRHMARAERTRHFRLSLPLCAAEWRRVPRRAANRGRVSFAYFLFGEAKESSLPPGEVGFGFSRLGKRRVSLECLPSPSPCKGEGSCRAPTTPPPPAHDPTASRVSSAPCRSHSPCIASPVHR